MQLIQPSDNEQQWPRQSVKSVDCRKRDLVIRIANWAKDKDEPAYDVEVYIGGVYDWNQSEVFSKHELGTMAKAKVAAIDFAQNKINELL